MSLRDERFKKKNNFEVNLATFEWFKKMRTMNDKVSGSFLQATLQFIKNLDVENFTASNGLLESFKEKKRHNVSQKFLCRNSHDIDMETEGSFKKRISDLLENYRKKDTINVDECDLFHPEMPS